MPLVGGFKTGVYRITNTVNGKLYIGSTCASFASRWFTHVKDLKGGYHPNRHLQRAWNKYGEKSFTFEVVERCHKSKCLKREQYWINWHHRIWGDTVYNISLVAGSTLGYKFTEEQSKRLSDSKRNPPQATRDKMSASAKAKMTPEWRRHLSEKAKQQFSSPEARRKMSLQKLGKKIHTMESKAKISAAVKGRVDSDETRKKKSESKLGKLLSSESRAKISATLKNMWATGGYSNRAPKSRRNVSASNSKTDCSHLFEAFG